MILSEKLQLKPGQQILVQNPQAGLDVEGANALLLFVTSLAEVTELMPGAIQKVGRNGLLWIAYPKGGSGVKTDFNRDRSLQPLAHAFPISAAFRVPPASA